MPGVVFLLAFALIALGADAFAQSGPPRDTKVVEKKEAELSNQDYSAPAGKALAIDPEKWRHAETENFILHYRRLTEAQKVAREIEFYIWFVARALEAKEEDYRKKSHVFVFEDDEEWRAFLKEADAPEWFASFALGDDLFLNVRRTEGSNRFASTVLAHETTHAVVSRIYKRRRWPLWLNEGFAEYMGGASVAARKNQTVKRHQQTLRFAEMSLTELEQVPVYPSEELELARIYQSSEKFVRFLMNELPRDRFPQFVERVLEGKSLKEAFMATYGDKFKDFEAFERRYERFDK